MKFLFNQDRDKVFDLTEHKEKRSNNANAYFHKLCSLIAECLNVSMIEVKNKMISDYGQLHFLEDGSLDWSVKPDSFNWMKCETEHYQPSDRYVMDKGRKYFVYFVMRGSHTYNTKEMSRLIDMTIQEAKELGIETLPPAEIERMLNRWKPSKGDLK